MDKQFWFTVVVAIICGILSNLGTPMVTAWSRRLVFLTRSHRIERLEQDLRDVRHLQSHQEDRQLYFWKQIFLILGAIALGLDLQTIDISRPFAALPVAWAAGRAYWTVELVRSLRRFESFEKETLQAIEGQRLKLKKS